MTTVIPHENLALLYRGNDGFSVNPHLTLPELMLSPLAVGKLRVALVAMERRGDIDFWSIIGNQIHFSDIDGDLLNRALSRWFEALGIADIYLQTIRPNGQLRGVTPKLEHWKLTLGQWKRRSIPFIGRAYASKARPALQPA